MAGLLSLAPELLLQICDELDISELDSLYETCIYLRGAVAPRLFHTVTISAHLNSSEICDEQLQALTEFYERIPQHARLLKILALNILSEEERWVPSPDAVGFLDTLSDNVRRRVAPSDAVIRLLGSTVESLTNLVSVELRAIFSIREISSDETDSWRVNPNDTQWAIDEVMDSLLVLPSLREFSVMWLPDAHVEQLSLNRLHSLTKLVAMNLLGRLDPDVVQSCIGNNPNLTYLELRSHRRPGESPPAMHELLVTTTTHLRLQHLSLWGYKLDLDETTLPHFRFLTSLELTTEGPYPTPFDTSATWQALRAECIFLKRLVAYEINPALLHYIASYSGLQTLHLYGLWEGTSKYSDALADVFFNSCLPQHISSLKDLLLRVLCEGRWCFSRNSAAHLIRCTQLREVMLPIVWGSHWKDGHSAFPTYRYPGDGEDQHREAIEDEELRLLIKQLPSTSYQVPELDLPDAENPKDITVIESLMELTSNLPYLHTLSIEVACPEPMHDGNPLSSWRNSTEPAIRTKICDFKPKAHKWYPQIKFGGNVYEVRREGLALKYTKLRRGH